MWYKPISTILYVQFLEVFCSGLVFEKIPFPIILFFHLGLTRIYLSGCSLASPLLGSFPATWVYAAAATTTPDAAPLKEQDLVSIAASWYVGSRAVMYSPLCPAYDRKLAILMSAASCIDDNAMCRELIKFGLRVCAAVRAETTSFWWAGYVFMVPWYSSVVHQIMISRNCDRLNLLPLLPRFHNIRRFGMLF
jgi:hypothetical protein